MSVFERIEDCPPVEAFIMKHTIAAYTGHVAVDELGLLELAQLQALVKNQLDAILAGRTGKEGL